MQITFLHITQRKVLFMKDGGHEAAEVRSHDDEKGRRGRFFGNLQKRILRFGGEELRLVHDERPLRARVRLLPKEILWVSLA